MSARLRGVLGLEALGAEVRAVSVDVTDETAMRALEEKVTAEQNAIMGKTAAPAAAVETGPKIPIDDFLKVDLRVGLVQFAERVKGSRPSSPLPSAPDAPLAWSASPVGSSSSPDSDAFTTASNFDRAPSFCSTLRTCVRAVA